MEPGWLFLGHLFRSVLAADQIDGYIVGLIVLAAAPARPSNAGHRGAARAARAAGRGRTGRARPHAPAVGPLSLSAWLSSIGARGAWLDRRRSSVPATSPSCWWQNGDRFLVRRRPVNRRGRAGRVTSDVGRPHRSAHGRLVRGGIWGREPCPASRGRRPAGQTELPPNSVLYAVVALAGAAVGTITGSRWMSDRSTRYVLAAISPVRQDLAAVRIGVAAHNLRPDAQ